MSPPQIPHAVAAWLGCHRLSEAVHEALDPRQALTLLPELKGVTLDQVGLGTNGAAPDESP